MPYEGDLPGDSRTVPVPDRSDDVVQAILEGLLLRDAPGEQLVFEGIGLEIRTGLHRECDSAARERHQAIARAAGVSPMTVRRLLRGQPHGQRDIPRRIRTAQASRLLAINEDTLRHAAVRRNAAGTRRRLQALIAMGHPAASLVRRLDMAPRTLSGILSGPTATVSHCTHVTVGGPYEQMWDLHPPERTAPERRAAAAARHRAARSGWPTPMGLADDLINDPVPLENRIRQVTCRSSGRQAAPTYSLIRPPRTGFRRICRVSMSVAVAG